MPSATGRFKHSAIPAFLSKTQLLLGQLKRRFLQSIRQYRCCCETISHWIFSRTATVH